MFFDRYPRFYGTSRTAPSSGRLNLRYEAIFAENSDVFEGARVLDIASHDGRWSLAALASGAKSVIGIEARPDLVEHATKSLAEYGYGTDRASFVIGDVYEVLSKQKFEVDVVLCLGYLYHTLRYNELLHYIRQADPKHVIIDTQARSMIGADPLVYLVQEKVDWQGNAVSDVFTHENLVLTGRPNLNAVQLMMGCYGFDTERISDWAGLVRDNPTLEGVGDYAAQRRMTIRFTEQRP